MDWIRQFPNKLNYSFGNDAHMAACSYPKRLIEVDLPIKRISVHARREKSIRHGHISTLHIWWARRPLAACRAVICAALWPDPADEHCPESFRIKAREEMTRWARKHLALLSGESLQRFNKEAQKKNPFENTKDLRAALLDFIADFSNWDNSTVREYLETSRALTQAAHESLGGVPGTRPLVVDPFAGGGSIPLEALRVGADVFASELNPVAVLLNKVVLEYIPKYGQRLADEVRKWGEWIKHEAEKELGEFYPRRYLAPSELKHHPVLLITAKHGHFGCVTHTELPDYFEAQDGYTHYIPITRSQAHGPMAMRMGLGMHGALLARLKGDQLEERLAEIGARPLKLVEETPIAYLWARTIQCEGPGCGAEVPLIRSLWLAKKANRSVALQLVPNKKAKRVDYKIIVKKRGGWVNQDDDKEKIADPKFDGTVKRGSATCPCCGYTTPVARVREQFKARHGGANDARMFCVVSARVDQQGRFYRAPSKKDEAAAKNASLRLVSQANAHKGELSLVPDEKLDVRGIRHTWAMIYGIEAWSDCFTPRQALALATIFRLADTHGQRLGKENDRGLSNAAQTCIALITDKLAQYNSSMCRWKASGENLVDTFGRQALPMVWDFAEANPFAGASGDFTSLLGWHVDALETTRNAVAHEGSVAAASATTHPYPDDSAHAFITDPPYYDAVPYAYLADFFYVWLRRVLRRIHHELMIQPLVPKGSEIVVDRPHELSNSTHDVAFYERELAKAFGEGRRILRPDGVGIIVFASKTTASWEAILKAVVDVGWIITGSWPIDTEMETRVAAQGQARLASSVHLICRPRENLDGSVRTDEIGDWRDVLQELPPRIHEWMPRLAEEGVVGADAIFACLGPALEIFSRYSRVEKASGEAVSLKEYLEQVWAAVAKEALTMVFEEADATGFEADARLTAMWLWTLNAGRNGTAEEAETDEEPEEEAKKPKVSGFVLEYDAARKIAQGLGAHLETLESLVEISGETARLLPVAERARYLFGKDEGKMPARKKQQAQLDLFKVLDEAEEDGAFTGGGVSRAGETILDRIHQAMILFAAGRAEAVKRFLVEDGVGRDQRFWRLAQALSALYPPTTDEKRWIDGVLARKKGLGF
jgi:putative DNA methylase